MRTEINESPEELEKLLKEHRESHVHERLQTLYLIKARHFTITAVAQALGKHRAIIQRWLAEYREEGGLTALLDQ
ncbi:MAG: helix-turn-helix domain-containing protein [Cyanobacteria bacterium P01_H01_bin.15]